MLLSCGGMIGGAPSDQCYSLDLTQGGWTAGPTLNTSLQGSMYAPMNGRLLLFGGEKTGGSTDMLLIFTHKAHNLMPSDIAAAYDDSITFCDTESCMVIGKMPNYYSGGTACPVGNHKVALLPYHDSAGGNTAPAITRDFVLYDLRTGLFTTMAQHPTDLQYPSCSYYLHPDTKQEYLIVSGDSDADGRETYIYAFATDTWSNPVSLRAGTALDSPGFLTIDGRLYRFGGGQGRVSKLSSDMSTWEDETVTLTGSGRVLAVVQPAPIERDMGVLGTKRTGSLDAYRRLTACFFADPDLGFANYSMQNEAKIVAAYEETKTAVMYGTAHK